MCVYTHTHTHTQRQAFYNASIWVKEDVCNENDHCRFLILTVFLVCKIFWYVLGPCLVAWAAEDDTLLERFCSDCLLCS